MTTQSTLVAKQVRLKEWAQQIHECKNRPKCMDVETWCTQNHLTRANYYYRLRRVREAYLEQMPDSVPTFVELPASESKETLPEKTERFLETESKPIIRLKNEKGLSAEVFSDTSPELLRTLIDGLVTIIRFQFQLDPYDKNTLFLFCGRRSDRIKALLWEGDGFLLLYKRLENGAFRWPRSADEALAITPEQYRMLMQGFEIVARNPIKELKEPPSIL